MFYRSFVISAIGAAALIGGVSGPAAAGTFGSTTYLTARSCSAVTAAQDCDGSGPGQQIFASSTDGGVGLASHANLGVAGGTASGAVSFGALALPVISASSDATGDVRMNSNNLGWQFYTYVGASDSPLSFTGSLNIDNSSASPLDGGLPNGAIYTSYVAIWDPSILAGLSSPIDLFTSLYGDDCSVPGVLAYGYAQGTSPGGPQTYSVTTHGCGADPFVIHPGETVYAVAGLQIPVDRGGFVDATHTFTMGLDPTLPDDVRKNLTENLIPAGAVPEPATWAMMVLGLGMIGFAARRWREGMALAA